MLSFYYNVESRKLAASLISRCLYENYLVREALKLWPDMKDDTTLMCARHALIHFEADKELFRRNPEYIDQQIDWLEQLINILSKGESIPKNILESYEEYYVIPVSFKSRILKFFAKILYPFISILTNILKLFKS
ncbi:MAG: hypothetical protein AB1782_10535 [Cyanobacteriota bacterium]